MRRSLAVFAACVACAAPAACGHEPAPPTLRDARVPDAGTPGRDADTSTTSPPDAGFAADAGSEADTGPPLMEDASSEDVGDPAYDGPVRLSETGLYGDIARRRLAFDVVPFEVHYELWADGAAKHRYLWLPPGEKIDSSSVDSWSFPMGTKVWKEFWVGGRLVETRLLQKRGPTKDDWLWIAFVWKEDGSDAIATPGGLPNAAGTTHDVPSQQDCWRCHTGGPDVLLGVSAVQLATDFGALVTVTPTVSLTPPGDPLTRDTLGYLNANCGHCHADTHPLGWHNRIRLRLPAGVATPEETPLYRTAIGGRAVHEVAGTSTVVVPGRPFESQLYMRMTLRDVQQMPPVGTKHTDPMGLDLVRRWIESLSR